MKSLTPVLSVLLLVLLPLLASGRSTADFAPAQVPDHWQLGYIRRNPVLEQPSSSAAAPLFTPLDNSPDSKWRDCEIVTSAWGGYFRAVELNQGPVLEARPLQREADHSHSDHDDDQVQPEAEFVVCRARSELECQSLVHHQCVGTVTDSHTTQEDLQLAEEAAADELFEFNVNGPANNRINVVFMGDGYTLTERQKYIDDMQRLIGDMFTGETFHSYLPTFNIYGVFRPSRESGIGTGGRPRDTAFQLYRDGTELRGVYTNKPQEARNACGRAPGCHYPTLIGNDNYYGGLGGEFVISTSSIKSGTIVLRHEMGHNFVYVGEEYDGGQVYRGVNFASSLSNLGWRHWLTDPNNVREERAAILVQDYAWYDLARGTYRIQFTSTGEYADGKWYLVFTVSGADAPNSIAVHLDGQPLNWETEGDLDRTFYRFYGDRGFSAGRHELTFQQLIPPAPGAPIRQLCSATMHEYAADYNWDDSFVGAYRTYRIGKSFAGYRPNNEYCLMRNMTSPRLCNVCQEGMWMQFLSRMSLIDGVDVETGSSAVSVKARLVPLGQYRPPADRVSGERYEISWSKNGQRQSQYDNIDSFSLDPATARGKWQLDVQFHTPEIRADPRRLTRFSKEFTIQ